MAPLSDNELWMLQADQISAFNFVLAAHLRSTPSITSVQHALKTISTLHPILSAELEGDEAPSWRPSLRLPPLEINGEPWSKQFTAQLNQRFSQSGPALFRLRWLREGEGSVFMLTFHPVLGDGRFGLMVLDDFLRAVQGMPTSTHQGTHLQPRVGSHAPETRGGAMPSAMNQGRHFPQSTQSQLAQRRVMTFMGQTSGIVSQNWAGKARRQGSTINGILSATHLQAVSNYMGEAGPLLLSMPIDLRFRLSPLDGPKTRSCLGDIRRTYWVDPADDPWVLARRINADLSVIRQTGQSPFNAQTVGADVNEVYRDRASCAVSNLGRFAGFKHHEALGLESIFFGVGCSVLGDSILAAVGCADRLSLTYCAMSPTLDLRSGLTIAQDSLARFKRAMNP